MGSLCLRETERRCGKRRTFWGRLEVTAALIVFTMRVCVRDTRMRVCVRVCVRDPWMYVCVRPMDVCVLDTRMVVCVCERCMVVCVCVCVRAPWMCMCV